MAGLKMTDAEINERVELCFDMRYKQGTRQVDWVKYCHEHYNFFTGTFFLRDVQCENNINRR